MRFSSLGFGVIAGLVFTGSASAGTVFDYGMLFEGLSVPGTTTGFQPDGSAFTLSGSLYDFSNAGTATSGDFESAFVSHVWSQAAITLTATAFDSTGAQIFVYGDSYSGGKPAGLGAVLPFVGTQACWFSAGVGATSHSMHKTIRTLTCIHGNTVSF